MPSCARRGFGGWRAGSVRRAGRWMRDNVAKFRLRITMTIVGYREGEGVNSRIRASHTRVLPCSYLDGVRVCVCICVCDAHNG